MIHVFEGHTADDAWQRAATAFRDGVDVSVQASRAGGTREILHSIFSVRDARQRWVGSRHPALNPAFAIVEVVWILRGRRDSAFLNAWNRRLPEYAGTGAVYHGAYGARLVDHFGVNQLVRAWEALSHNPDSRQVVLQIWDPRVDLPDQQGVPRSPDIPCNLSAILKLRGGALEWTQILRSNDLFLGVPYNIVQFTTVQEVLAGWLNARVGGYHQLSDSLHIYERDASAVESSVPLQLPENTDTLAVPKPESDRLFSQLETRIEHLAGDLQLHELQRLALLPDAPVAYSNLLCIVAAESARRHGWMDLAEEVMSRCTNPLLRVVWQRWIERYITVH